MNKNKLIEHILKSDLTATEKRYLEGLVNAEPKTGKWLTIWEKKDYHEMETGEYAYQYSECWCGVVCSCCKTISDSFKWDKSGKGKQGIEGLAYRLQFSRIKEMKTDYCPNCGAKMDE